MHPHRNIILRAVDGVHDTEPDLFHLALEPGDRLLLCSDGCTGGVDDAGIERLLAEGNVDSAALTLVQAALDGGSTDNVTVVVAEVVAADAPADPELASATTGPMLVGAAAAQPRRGAGAGRGVFRRQSDTDEIEPVPADPDAAPAGPVDPEELRYAPRPPRRFLGLRRLALALVPLILLAGGVVFGYVWSQNQYYVAADGDRVAIYQGVQMDLPLVSLSSLHQPSDVVVAELPCFDQEQVQAGIVAGDLTAAERIVTNLEEQAARQRERAEAEAEREARRAAERARKQDRTGGSNGGNQTEPAPSPSPSPSAVDATVDCSGSGSESGAESGSIRVRAGGRDRVGVVSTASASPGFVHRRRRGAELILMLLALAVGVGAYAAVGLGVEDELPADMIGYSIWLAALAVAAHVVVRWVAPWSDPVLLPVVTALNGLGLAMIYRIDLASDTDLSAKQLMWTTLGVVLFAVVLVVLRDHRRLQAFTYTIGLLSIFLLLLPMIPGLGKEINGARIWIGIGGFSFQPGEVAKICLVVAFAGYLVLHRDALALAGRRFAGIDLPRGRDLGPILAMWLVSLMVLVGQRDLGSSLLFFGLFLVMLYIATERPGWLVVGFGAVRRRRARGVHLRRARADPGPRLARPLRRHRQLRPDRAGALRHGLGRAGGPRARPGRALAHPVRLLRLHHRLDRRGARADRPHRHPAAVRARRRARAAHRPHLPRRLRQADGGRLRGRLRPPGVRRRRRCHPAHPA